MGNIRVEGKKLIYQRKDELTIIEPYGMNCLRCRSTKNSKILDENWTVLPPATADDCHIECDGRFATITNGAMKATIDAGQIWYGGIITYFKKDTPVLHTRFEGDYSNRNQHIEGDHYKISVIFDANEGEHFYGIGQEQVDLFDRKGTITPNPLFLCSTPHLVMVSSGIIHPREDVRQQEIILCLWLTVLIRQTTSSIPVTLPLTL